MKKSIHLFILLIFSSSLRAQVRPDRVGFISSPSVVPHSSLQIEAGHFQSFLDYGTPFLLTTSSVLLRKSASEIHEFRVGFLREPKVDGVTNNLSLLTLGAKLRVAHLNKLKIAFTGTWGVDLRTILDDDGKLYERGPSYFLQLDMPVEYELSKSLSLQGQLRQNVAVSLFGRSPAYTNARQSVNQSDINIALRKKIGATTYVMPGMVNHFIQSKSGDNGKKPEWAELSYLSFAAQTTIGGSLALDVGVLYPLFTGANQYDPSGGIAVQGGVTYSIKHRPLREKKPREPEDVY